MSLCINPACPAPNHPDNHKNRFCKSCGSQLELLGRYRVIRVLSDRIGLWNIYEAYEQNTPKILKVLNKNLSNDAKAVELFQQEIALMKQLNHPGIPQFDNYFQYETRNGLVLHCIVMEKIDETNLEDWLKQQNQFLFQEKVIIWLKQQAENTTAMIKVVDIPPTEHLSQKKNHTPSQKTATHSEKLPLIALIAAMFASLGLFTILALATDYPQFAFLITQTQSPETKGKIDYFPYEEGRDRRGRVAEFNIAVLSVDYKWLLGSNFQVKYNDKIISLDALKLSLEQENIQQIMEAPHEIISVGTASCEGKIATEQLRALERSQQIQLLSKKLFRNTPSVKGYRLLNLGRFQRGDCQTNQHSTIYQKSIIIIGVKKQSAGVIVDEALRDRLEKKPFADFKLEDYSLGSANKFKTIPRNL